MPQIFSIIHNFLQSNILLPKQHTFSYIFTQIAYYRHPCYLRVKQAKYDFKIDIICIYLLNTNKFGNI